jgi:hypothetical protein
MQQENVESTTIYEQHQELKSMNVAGMPHTTWPNPAIQNSRVTSANMTHLTKISAVNCKQLSSDITDPQILWYLQVGSVKAEPQWPAILSKSMR